MWTFLALLLTILNFMIFQGSGKVVGFWNIYTNGDHFSEIVLEQFEVVKASGLLSALDALYYLTSGSHETAVSFAEPKIVHIRHQTDGNEMHTLKALQEHCKLNVDDKVLYFHNKGSFHYFEGNNNFRKALDCFNLNPHCIEALENFDTCGFRMSPLPYPHYPGNFWWARCDYVKNLVDPMSFWSNETFLELTQSLVVGVEYGFKTCDHWKCAPLGLGRYFSETWIGTSPRFNPADCLPSQVDSKYLLGTDVPLHEIAPFCPTNVNGQVAYGLSCGSADITHSLDSMMKYKEAIVKYRNNGGGYKYKNEHLMKLVVRSKYWYGEIPHTALEMFNLMDLLEFEEYCPRDGDLIKGPDSPSVFLLEQSKREFKTQESFESRGYNFLDVIDVRVASLEGIPDGDPIY